MLLFCDGLMAYMASQGRQQGKWGMGEGGVGGRGYGGRAKEGIEFIHQTKCMAIIKIGLACHVLIGS